MSLKDKMLDDLDMQSPVFVNTLGHLAGLLLFGLVLFLMKSGSFVARRQNLVTMMAAFLAFLWNLGSLIGLAFIQRDGEVPGWLVAIDFSFLSLLPAVLFSVVLKGQRRWLVRLGYAISLCSVLLHFAELMISSARLHEAALLVVTIGFVFLGPLTLVWNRAKSSLLAKPPLTDLVCLMLLTLSFLHFGYGHSRTAWTSELVWHHAGVPLALIVLLRDYRLLLAEALIRFVANVGLAGLFSVSLYLLAETGNLWARVHGNSFLSAVLAVFFCLAIVGFAYLRSTLQRHLTRTLFGRGDLTYHSQKILQAASDCNTEEQFLQRASLELLEFVEAEEFTIVKDQLPPPLVNLSIDVRSTGLGGIKLPLRFSRGDSVTLWLGHRRGSRRYLAEDISSLQSLTRLIVEQVERLRSDRLQSLAHEAELRALRAQINPHFLFNALNTLYGTIDRESGEARRLVLNLADLFRYSLQSNHTWNTLEEELQIVQAYLEIERVRLQDRLRFEINASPEVRAEPVPALSLQPLVENAIKHGIARMSANGQVQVMATKRDGILQITVTDNGPGSSKKENPGLGIGLENVRQRLHLCCGAGSDLVIDSREGGFSATIRIVQRPDSPTQMAAEPFTPCVG